MKKKFHNKKTISLLVFVIVLLLAIIIDLVTKHYIIGIDKPVISGFFKFEYAENTGAAWSIFSGSTVALSIVSVFAIILLSIYAIFAKTKSLFFHISLGMIVGGACGNLFDRIVFGYVRDFIKLEFVKFPIFNIADSFLTIGIILLCVYYLIDLIVAIKKNKKERKWTLKFQKKILEKG